MSVVVISTISRVHWNARNAPRGRGGERGGLRRRSVKGDRTKPISATGECGVEAESRAKGGRAKPISGVTFPPAHQSARTLIRPLRLPCLGGEGRIDAEKRASEANFRCEPKGLLHNELDHTHSSPGRRERTQSPARRGSPKIERRRLDFGANEPNRRSGPAVGFRRERTQSPRVSSG